MKRRILSLALIVIMMVSLLSTVAFAETSYSFDEATGILTISGYGEMINYASKNAPWNDYVKNVKAIVVKEGITSIGNWAFAYCVNLAEVTLPSTLKTIGKNSFYRCKKLTSIEVPAGVTSFDSGAFAYCETLKEITIPNSLNYVGKTAFVGCGFLVAANYLGTEPQWEKITIKKGNECLTNAYPPVADPFYTWEIKDGVLTINGNIAMDNYTAKNSPWYDRAGEITAVVVTNGVKTIGNWAFAYLKNVTSVEIADTVEAIGINAFYRCTSLKEVTVPAGVKKLGGSAFAYCDGLEEITLPESVNVINDYTFIGCDALTVVNADLENVEIAEKGNDALFTITNLPEAGVTELGSIEAPYQGIVYTLDTAYDFKATQTAEEVENSEFRYYHADFVVSFDKDINDIVLAGYYKAYADYVKNQDWVPMMLEDVKAGEEYRLLSDVYFDGKGSINYEELCKCVKEFRCGAYDIEDDDTGVTMTVELRLYETKDAVDTENNTKNVETGKFYTVGTYTHTF